ncbi:MAG: hypothetical protein ACT4OL_05685 [Nitrospiraceae bacterium]
MWKDGSDRHQLAGLDHRERGFSRPVEFEPAGESYQAIFRYESTLVRTEPHPSQDIALHALVQTLQAQGYRQLRTQGSFRKGIYLGSQEMWVEYPDPPQPEPERPGFMARILSWFCPRSVNG